MDIIEEARNSLKDYCAEECKAYCCRKGYLVMDEASAKLFKNLKKINEKQYSVSLQDDCPNLINFKCIIHKNPDRPKACQDFPIFLEGKTIKLSNRCLAVKEGKFYGFIKEMESLGYKITQIGSLADSDFFKNIKL